MTSGHKITPVYIAARIRVKRWRELLFQHSVVDLESVSIHYFSTAFTVKIEELPPHFECIYSIGAPTPF
jgi:hypothetical protein